MPFIKANMIQEAIELQDVFKDDLNVVKEFREFEEIHKRAEQIRQEEMALRNKLVEIRKKKNITQKEIQEKTGLTQQAVSRLEVSKDISPNLNNLLSYANAIGIDFKKYLDMELSNFS